MARLLGMMMMMMMVSVFGHSQTVSWSKYSYTNAGSGSTDPKYVGYLQIKYGLGKTWLLVSDNASSIYSNSLWTFSAGSGTLTKIGTSGSVGFDPCPASTGTWPGDRHPIGQLWFDTDSSELFQAGGVCSGNGFSEMWKIANGSSTWSQLTPAATPWGLISNKWVFSDCAYDSQNTVAKCFGYDYGPASKDNMLYCPTHGTGTLSGAQITAGCTVADSWVTFTTTGGEPGGRLFPTLAYRGGGLILMFGGATSGSGTEKNEVWQYTTATKTWTRLHDGSGTAPPAVSYSTLYGQAMFAWDTSRSVAWSLDIANRNLWKFDPGNNTWTNIGTQSSGPPAFSGSGAAATTMVYDTSQDALVIWAQNPTSTGADIWVGSFSNPPQQSSAGGSTSRSGSISRK